MVHKEHTKLVFTITTIIMVYKDTIQSNTTFKFKIYKVLGLEGYRKIEKIL